VNKSENFEPVETDAFLQEEEVWDSTNGIKPKVELEVVEGNGLDILMSHGSFDEAEEDFDSVNDIDNSLNVHQSLLAIN